MFRWEPERALSLYKGYGDSAINVTLHNTIAFDSSAFSLM